MSRSIKVLWIVIGGLFVLGVVLATIGFALGATGSVWLGRDGLHFGAREAQTVELSEGRSASFENIDVQLIEADVEIVTAENYGYEFTYYGTQEPSIEIVNNTLKVIEEENNWGFNIIRFTNIWDVVNQEARLTVYVPKTASIDSVSLYTASGDTVLNGNQISINSLDCKSASGNIDLHDLELTSLQLDVASGDVSISNVTAENAIIDMASGELVYNGAELDSLKLNIMSGSVFVSGTIEESLDLSMVSGDADFELEGNEDDYKFDISRISGDIQINGRAVSDETFEDLPGSTSINSNSNTSGHIRIDVTSGSVNINIK